MPGPHRKPIAVVITRRYRPTVQQLRHIEPVTLTWTSTEYKSRGFRGGRFSRTSYEDTRAICGMVALLDGVLIARIFSPRFQLPGAFPVRPRSMRLRQMPESL